MYDALSQLVRRVYLGSVDDDTTEDTTSSPPARQSHKDANFEEISTSLGVTTSNGAAESAFFQRLPDELRRLILIHAFGDRTVHVDYPDDPGLQRGPSIADWIWLPEILKFYDRRGNRHWRSGGGGGEGPNQQSPPLKECFAFFCDNTSLSASRTSIRFKTTKTGEVWKRKCLLHYCASKGPGRERARIGVSGWLRACRQAYIEGIEVLYETNRFHIVTPSIETNQVQYPAPNRIVPLPTKKHLAMITSLQLVCTLGRVAQPPPILPREEADNAILSNPRFAGWHAFLSLCETIPSTFYHLRDLRLSMDGEWFPVQMAPNDIVRRFETDLLAPIDEMVETIFRDGEASSPSSPTEIVVAIPIPRVFWTWDSKPVPMKKELMESDGEGVEMGEDSSDGFDEEAENDVFAGHVWRSLLPPSSSAATAKREETGLADEREKQDAEGERKLGYWITHFENLPQIRKYRTMPVLLQIILQKGAMGVSSR